MLSRTKKTILVLTGALALMASGTALATLTTEELTRLKASGLGEAIIRFIIDNDYGNVDRVVKLKEAGFADETIASVIKSDLKAGGQSSRSVPLPVAPQPAAPQPPEAKPAQPSAEPAAEARAIMRTSAKVKIEQYLALGEPVVQNSQDIPDATVSLLEGRRLKIEWAHAKPASGLGKLLWRTPFASPFYWDLSEGDRVHGMSAKDNAFTLRTGHLHQGSPATNKAQYWLMHLTPDSPELAKRIRELLVE